MYVQNVEQLHVIRICNMAAIQTKARSLYRADVF